MSQNKSLFRLLEIPLLVLFAFVGFLLLYPYYERNSSDDQLKEVNEVIEKSINQSFSKEMELIVNEAQKDGKLTRKEADFIVSEYEHLKLKQTTSQLNESNKINK